MNAELEIHVDSNGNPLIRFRHHDKDNSIQQKLLGNFINAVKERGCQLVNPKGHLDSSNGISWEEYEIKPNTN